MTQWVLKANGNVVPRRTIRPLNTSELSSDTENKKRTLFDELIEKRWGTSVNPPNDPLPSKDFLEYEDDDEDPHII